MKPKFCRSGRWSSGCNKGFTLIELLVVIAIIGLLAGVITLRAANARSKSRDAKRKADINQLRKSLDLYFDDFSTYPVPTSGVDTEVELIDSLIVSSMTPYMAQLPRDPSCPGSGVCTGTPQDYKYIVSTDQQNYAVFVPFGNDENLTTCKVMSSGGDPAWFGGVALCNF